MRRNIKACLSSNTDEWKTPSWLYNYFMDHGYKDLFPYQCSYNEMENNYFHEKLFVNPPFSCLNLVTEWLIKQIQNQNKIALLIPSRTDTGYWHRLLVFNPKVYFIKGRLHFNDSEFGAPFPCVLLIFRNYKCPVYRCISQNGLLRGNL